MHSKKSEYLVSMNERANINKDQYIHQKVL